MNDKTKYLVIVLGVFVAGFLFAFSTKPGGAAAANEKKLRDGHETLEYIIQNPPQDPQSFMIPVGVVLTDLILQNLSSEFGLCNVSINGVNPNIRGEEKYLTIAHVIDDNLPSHGEVWQPSAELHFESGLHSTDTRQIEIELGTNVPCKFDVLWTGYEQ